MNSNSKFTIDVFQDFVFYKKSKDTILVKLTLHEFIEENMQVRISNMENIYELMHASVQKVSNENIF